MIHYRITAGLLFSLAGCAPANPPVAAPPEPAAHLAPGLSSPGKPRAPVTIRADLPAEVAPGSDVKVAVSITPSRDCVRLTARLRGSDGVRVSQPEPLDGHPRAGETVVANGSAYVGVGVAGLVVVDVDMVVGRKSYSTTQTFPLGATGVRRPMETIGTPTRDAQGKPIILMQSR